MIDTEEQKPAQCKTCKAPIKWIGTQGGGYMPVEARPEIRYLENGKQIKMYVPHWQNCKNAEMHRKGRG